MCLDKVIPVSNSPIMTSRSMIVKDFNEDGYDDVLIANPANGAIEIYVNNQNGTFTPTMVLPGTGIGKFNSIAVGKFNSDSQLDIALAYNNNVKIFENISSMNFTQNPSYSLPVVIGYSDTPSYLKVQDLNNDQLDDLVLCSPKTGTGGIGVQIFRNNFSLPSVYSFIPDFTKQLFQNSPALSINNYMDFCFGDFDGDFRKDIMFTYSNKLDSVIFLKNLSVNNGSLTLMPIPVRSPTVLQSYSVTCFNCQMNDLTGDGFDDGVVLISATNGAATVKGFAMITGTNTIPTTPPLYQSVLTGFANPSFPNDFKLGDVNNDGYKDFVGINDTKLWIYLWDPVPTGLHPLGHFNDQSPFFPVIDLQNVTADEMTLGDFDGNSLPDIFFKPWRIGLDKINLIPNISYAVGTAAGDTLTCPGKSASFSVTINPSIGSYNHSVDWYNTSQPGVAVTNPVMTTTIPGNYYPVLNIPFPFTNTATCVVKIKSDTVRVYSVPAPTINLSSVSLSVCAGNTASITASSVGGSTLSFVWYYGAGTFSTTPTIVSVPINNLEVFTVIGTDITNSCVATETAYVNVFPPNQDQIVFSQNPICLGDSAQLIFPTAGSYTWSTLSNNNNIYVKPVVGTDYDLIFKDLNGCVSNKIVRINIDLKCDIKIYTGISMNEDQANDIWLIDNISRFPNNFITIYNRWGKKVFEKKGYDNINVFWPPKDNKFDPATYYYMIDLGNGSEKIKGWIELIKN